MSPQAPFIAPERDEAYRVARPRSSGGTQYVGVPGVPLYGLAASAINGDKDRYAPFVVASSVVVDRLQVEVTTLAASGNLRIGLYRADKNWQPIGAPLADSGDISTASTGVKTYTPGTPLYLSRGRYLSVLNDNGFSPKVRANKGGVPFSIEPGQGTSSFVTEMFVTRSYAAFPTPGTAWDSANVSSTGVNHYVLYRVSAL